MDQDSLLVKRRNDNHSLIWNPIVLILHTCMQLSLKIYLVPTIPTSSRKCHMRFMIGSGMELVGIFRLFPSVRYCILPGAVWCGAVHTFSHTLNLCLAQPNIIDDFCQELLDYFVSLSFRGSISHVRHHEN